LDAECKAVSRRPALETPIEMASMTAQSLTVPEFTRELPRTRDALAFAAARHAGQRREVDDAPFVMHPLEVARLLDEAGYPDHVVAAGVLHDVLEDTDTGAGDLTQRFGPQVARLVSAVTEDPSITDRAERKAALRGQVARAGIDAAAVFAADKVSKVREMRERASRGLLDPERDRARLEHYEESLEMLAALLPGHGLVERLRRELEAVGPVRGGAM
jgi:(p)ppGpp synthase/HD superfamily hydrolase